MAQVTWLFRRHRALGNFSIENTFASVLHAWGPDPVPKWVESPEFSEGLVKRWKIIRYARRIETDILHITGDIHFAALAWPSWRRNRPVLVLTIHDIGFLAEFQGIKKWFFQKFWIHWPLRCVDHVVVVSKATKVAVLHEAPWYDPNMVSVIPSIVPQHFEPRQHMPKNQKPVALHIGLASNKNLVRHAIAMQGINLHLRIIGEPRPPDLALLDSLGIEYSWKARLSTEEMQAEYARADFLLFASTLEGFGMPIIEAQVIGLPVITSDLDPMREVAGDAALLCNPLIPDSIRESILKIIHNNDLKHQLISSGFINVQRFSVHDVVRQHQNLYRRLSSERPMNARNLINDHSKGQNH